MIFEPNNKIKNWISFNLVRAEQDDFDK